MKYTYFYKSGDGVRHEGLMNAKSREDVFSTLRKQGIKAIKVVAADGSKANGEVRGFRKRSVVCVAIVAAVVAGLGVFAFFHSEVESGPTALVKPLARQAISGDRLRIDGASERIFTLKAERFLARFAEPGRPYSAPEIEWPRKADFEAAFGNRLRSAKNEFTEHIDLKRIVTGMKREMQVYLGAGGLVSGYIKELMKRQDIEIEYRVNAEKQLKKLLAQGKSGVPDREALKKSYEYWLSVNAQLHSMGISRLPIPAVLQEYQRSTMPGE